MLAKGEDMDLRDYLYIKRMTIVEFSELIGYSRNHISGIINGRLKPNKRLAQLIEIKTGGEVKAEELMQDIPEKKIPKENPKKEEEKPNPKLSPKGWAMEKSVFDEENNNSG